MKTALNLNKRNWNEVKGKNEHKISKVITKCVFDGRNPELSLSEKTIMKNVLIKLPKQTAFVNLRNDLYKRAYNNYIK